MIGFQLFKTCYIKLKPVLLGLMLLMPTGSPAIAQIVRSDRTTGTVVTNSAPFTITEGTLRSGDTGTTLFHSFESFSPATSQVIFNLKDSQNAIDTRAVTAIIGRVTGGSESFINGELTVLQDSNTPAPDLFFINPQGILFGENATLSLPGSFLASTAESILFTGGNTFSAINPGAAPLLSAPLLSVSAPIGLQFGKDSSNGITLRGNGPAIATISPNFAPYFSVGTHSGLSVAPGESLRLIGGLVNIEGGVLSAPGGNVSVGGVQAGIVSLKEPTLDYRDVEKFGDILLTERSLVEVGGTIAGSVQLQGRNILLSDGSLIWSQNRGLAAAGEISVSATEQILFTGTTPSVEATSGIISETLAPGNAGNLNITASQLAVQAGATLLSRSFGSGDTGHLEITTEQTVISGYAPTAPNVFSAAATVTFLSGSGNDAVVSAQNLSITEGGYLGASTFGSGQGGNVQITSNTIEVIGATPASIGSNIGANTAGLGNSGNIVLRTNTLNLQDNGLVNTASASGNAGNILIDASERIDISGGRPNLPTSRIASTVNFPPLGLQLLLGLSGTPRGSSGDIVIHTPILNIRALGTVTVANFAEGSAGQLTIHAGSVVVEQGAIDAFTKAGDGGNITLNVRDVLLLRAGNINATAKGGGNGGNLRINSPIIIGLENSDITASATTGNGGNIDITAQAIFGLTPRAQQTAESDITASSQFGLSGTVSVNGLAVRPEAVLVELSEELSDPDTQVSKSCTASQRNQFIVSGRGGLPPAPKDGLVLTDPWEDLRAIAPTSNHATIDPPKLTPAPPEPATLLEASGWQTDAAGQVILTATTPEPRQIDSGNCLTQAKLRE